jgi:cytosine/adenosine deaminase-related metal-dependent hydrolase
MTGMIILPDWLITTASAPPREHWGVRIVGSQIVEVAPHADLRTKYPADQVWNADDQVLSPGFVNAHTHLYGVLAHGIPLHRAPADFWGFLNDFWWPLVEDQLDHAMIRAATDLRCAQMLKSGVTAFYDCTEAPYALPGVLPAQAEIVRHWGLRGVLSFEATERVSVENGQQGLKENADFIDACAHDNGLVSGLMCFHTAFTCSEKLIRQAFELAHARRVITHMHCAEGAYEPHYTLKHFGKRPIHYYNNLGVTGTGMLASQCVQMDRSEIAVMAACGVRMTHMPLSNCEVGGGIAPVPDLIESGVTVGLGSDGYIDDFFEVMRGAFLIHKADRRDPGVMPAALVWGLATEGGAQALGLAGVGRILEGAPADIQLIDLSTLPTPSAAHNLYDQLVLYRSAADVRAVWVNGVVRVQDGAVIGADLPALTAHTREQADRLWAKAQSF